MRARGKSYLLEVSATRARDSIVLGQPLVDEAVVGGQHRRKGRSLRDQIGEEEPRLLRSRQPEGIVILIGEDGFVRRDQGRIEQGEPTRTKVLDEGVRSKR